MSEQRRPAHVERIPVRWGDMDAMGHVNNTVYFRYMEQARIGWFDALVPDGKAWDLTGVVIADAHCSYLRPITYPGVVEVRLYVGRIGGSSVATSYELRVGADPRPYANGAAMVVFIDMAKQRPVRIPQPIRTKLERVEVPA